MKILYTLLAALMLCSFGASAQKFGHINSQVILQAMPEVAAATKQLEVLQTQSETQLKALGAEYDKLVAEYQNNAASAAPWSEAIRKNKETAILQLQQRVQDFQDDAQADIQKKTNELQAPIIKKLEDAIKAIAAENGYAYIFDTSPGTGVLFAQPSDDIAPMVRKKLGMQ